MFGGSFAPSFLKELNVAALRVDEKCPCVMCYIVCGTHRPDVFNANTCRRCQPVNVYGIPYSPSITTQMKASAISYGCINRLIWLATKLANKHGICLCSGVRPFTFCSEGILLSCEHCYDQ
ncbi:hypothetical protein TraAM80_08611 [Trypanosoma rangeli]|uniref:Uncharacterized protein n=1 Tax=Trypanosoma rangeli TaxID=5698 RepID=A0A422MZY9_TRYRA|nr:uncharacterized protein TraAM80_08611 [Trypanosoma rangeli]RNE98796.1 hypothetical protein TraAM80_08611 [Trypanosoma rangeli]|eukprot:RNE98796.1 hypothetical protein TraAM80_08611 [Trypanosoma rangeli]